VCEPAASSIAEGVLVECGPTLPPLRECLASTWENCFDFGEVIFLPSFLPSESVCFLSNYLVPPNLPVPPPLQYVYKTFGINITRQSPATPATQSSLHPISPSDSLQPPLSGMDPPWYCWEPSLPGCGKPMALPSASGPWGAVSAVCSSPQWLSPSSAPPWTSVFCPWSAVHLQNLLLSPLPVLPTVCHLLILFASLSSGLEDPPSGMLVFGNTIVSVSHTHTTWTLVFSQYRISLVGSLSCTLISFS